MITNRTSDIKKQWKKAISSSFAAIMTNRCFFLTNKFFYSVNDTFSETKGNFPASTTIIIG